MSLSVDQVLALAPDASAVAAAKKLGDPRPWRGVATSERALWGECQGSAVYQVRVDLASLVGKCSRPSRKFPCKHVLGLLLLSTAGPLPVATEPDWVTEWLDKRAAAADAKEKKAAQTEVAPVDEAARARRADQRRQRVDKGIEALELWMRDLVRNGLGGLETQPASFWEAQAARLIDAQAPGLAAQVRALADIAGQGTEWPARLVDALGRIALLAHAYRRGDLLDESLRADVRQRVGFVSTKEEVLATGARVSDEWIVIGQNVDEEARLRVQRTWLLGAESRTSALILQFAPGTASFEESFLVGTSFRGELAFFPGPMPQRALVTTRASTPSSVAIERIPGHTSFASALESVADALARSPLIDRLAFYVHGVVPVVHAEDAFLVDRDGAALRVEATAKLPVLALSGGHPIALAAEWDGVRVRPLAIVADGALHVLGGSP